MKPVFGLTGGIACGKSTVARHLTAHGAIVIDADQIARDVVIPPSPVLDAICDAFGSSVLREDGTLDRARLGEIVFSDVDARRRLESIIHPAIARASMERIQQAQQREGGPIFYEAALLVEQGTWRSFAGLLVVSCAHETQVERLMRRDHLPRAEAEQRIASQLPVAEKEAVARWVLRNDGDVETLGRDVVRVLDAIRREITPEIHT
jgi:dephospho-CoA kinase